MNKGKTHMGEVKEQWRANLRSQRDSVYFSQQPCMTMYKILPIREEHQTILLDGQADRACLWVQGVKLPQLTQSLDHTKIGTFP